ncbi:hypothetical protein G3M48_005346 [Beauveria asiatica]|uniref:Uncharacterized protein n=1 Tax=Beauveria asiatica TaxID=1069075 RepID=A0AAW0RRB5_9HYPO
MPSFGGHGSRHLHAIVTSVFHKCVLAHWLRYEAYPGHVVSFMRGGQGAGRRALLVHLWAKGSIVDYFPRSHLLELAATKGGRLLWETPKDALSEAGCIPCEKCFDEGGLVILDARIKYEIKTGYAITFELGTEDLVRDWPKMELPKLEVLERKVASMQSAEVQLNFTFDPSLVAKPE